METPEITESNSQPMSVADWMLTIFLTAIPLVGIIMLFVWAFGGGSNTSKKNWAKATLIWFAILTAGYVILFVLIFSSSGVM